MLYCCGHCLVLTVGMVGCLTLAEVVVLWLVNVVGLILRAGRLLIGV